MNSLPEDHDHPSNPLETPDTDRIEVSEQAVASSAHPHPHESSHGGPHANENPHEHAHPSESAHLHDRAHPHEHPHPHEGAHSTGHDHAAGHDHAHAGLRGWVSHLFKPHTHSHYEAALDPALSNERGIWAVKVSLVALLITAFFQVGIVTISGSVALLADTIHNFSDALTAIPLGLAFMLARRQPNRRYTYGYGRAEDLAGVLIVVMIFGSAMVVFYESIQKIIHHQVMTNLGWVALAAVIGFIGNELVAIFRIRIGREIGSAALIADGLHARTDGLTSLAVLLGVIGVLLGFPLADPLIGFAIGAAILVIVWGAAKEMWFRMMDAVDPGLVEQVEQIAREAAGVLDVHDVTFRWVGHRQRGELHITVDRDLPTRLSHAIAEELRHRLYHAMPALVELTVHVDPSQGEDGEDLHPSAHHVAHRQRAAAA